MTLRKIWQSIADVEFNSLLTIYWKFGLFVLSLAAVCLLVYVSVVIIPWYIGIFNVISVTALIAWILDQEY